MNRKRRYAELMQRALEAHREHQRVWAEAKASVLGNARVGSPEYLRANGHAYEVARPHAERRNEALYQLFSELPTRDDLSSADAVDNVLDFLEIDIPAFRCGYAKEWYLTRLKRVPLRQRHIERLHDLALTMCQSPYLRRELPYVGRLMIRIADGEFVRRLDSLCDDSSPLVRRKASRMLVQILNGRKDLTVELRQPTEATEDGDP